MFITECFYKQITIEKKVLEALHYLHSKCEIIHTDLKPENVLMCVDESHVKELAEEAENWIKNGIKPNLSSGKECIF